MNGFMRLFVFLAVCALAGSSYANCDVLYGGVETVTLKPEGMVLHAKLDTGAKTASLTATHIQRFTFHGNTWVSFTVQTKDRTLTFKRRLRKYVKVKTRAEEALGKVSLSEGKDYTERPEILMRVMLGNKEKVIAIGLADRSNFIYPLLLGRDAIKTFGGCIDPSRFYIADHPDSVTLPSE